MPQRIAITRGVSPSLARCELTHVERRRIDVDRARAQHAGDRARLESLGCRLVSLPAAEALPDCVFVEDAALVFDEVAVITRPGAPSRRPETALVTEALAPFRSLRHVEPPDTIDGGDVLRLDRKVFVGISTRTTPGAVAQLDAILHPLGYAVRGVPMSGCLHLKTAVTQVAPGAVLLNPAWVDASLFREFDVVEVDPAEPMAANALLIGANVVYPEAFRLTRARLEGLGLAVHVLDVSELARAEGGVTCCSLVFLAARSPATRDA